MKTHLFLAALLTVTSVNCFASEETIAIAKIVDGIEIPILVRTPETGTGPFPVVFHVHGGGWNGGTATEVPAAGVGQDVRFLCDQFGIIYVGLAYRCKNQRGTFQLAMSDLRELVSWFRQRAAKFKADMSRIGFSGGSAGTPLSALLAQQTSQCKTYLGCWGVYDFTDNKESLFPDQVAREKFGLSSDKQALAASAFHNLRTPPPISLLMHGGRDILTHASQSIKFGKQIQAQGGAAEVIIFPTHNHNFVNPNNPVAFKKAIVAIAKLYTRGVQLDDADFVQLE